MELISVIVPVYNVEKYLGECVKSICAQTYKNIEIILVDDGSSDNCPDLCDDYASTDSRVKVIHQMNQGLSVARNKGYEISNGKYIAFVDADDVVFGTYIETLYRLITANNAQIAICAYTRTLTKHEAGNSTNYTLDVEKMLKEWHGRRKAMETVVWNKLYSRQIFENFKDYKLFPEGKTHEDVYTSHLFIHCAERVSITDEILYFYRKRENSISREYTKEAVQADLEAQRVRLRFFKEKKLYKAYLRLLVGHLLHKVMYAVKTKHLY